MNKRHTSTKHKRKYSQANRKRTLRIWKNRLIRISSKIAIRLFALLILCGILSIFCFRYLMHREIWAYIKLVQLGYISFDGTKILEELQEKAAGLSIRGKNEKEIKKVLDLKKYDDGYTSIAFYDSEGLFEFYGFEPNLLNTHSMDSFWYEDVSYYNGMNRTGLLEFQDMQKTVIIYSMHQAQIAMPYFFFCLSVSILFMLPIPLYIWTRMRYVGRLKKEILVMADGDLEHPITVKGTDDISILAKNLDHMRLALEENNRSVQEGKQANRDLISAVSHDLRTPLTTLYSYLEILNQKKCPPEKQAEYLTRCMEKAAEIRTLSDRMFEYALVYEKDERADLTELYLDGILELLEQNMEYLSLKGIHATLDVSTDGNITLLGNQVLFQRIFNNLFSNLIKYSDPSQPSLIKLTADRGWLQFVFLNWKQKQKKQVESNRIGLKSVEKMTELQGGKFFVVEEQETFAITLRFPFSQGRGSKEYTL